MVSLDAADEAEVTDNGEQPAASAHEGGTDFGLSPATEQTEVRSTYRRDIADIAREEMMVVIRKVFAESGALDTETAVRAIARQLGFARTGQRIDESIRKNLTVAVRRRILTSERGTYALYCRNIGDYDRDGLIDALLGAMGRGWTERENAIRAATRRLGFQRTGRAIQDAFKSAFKGAIRRGRLEKQGSQIRNVG